MAASSRPPRKARLERPAHIRFDERRADRAVRFFKEYLRHTDGRFAGRPFNLQAFQEQDLREIFGRVREDGTRVIRQVYKEIPKKQGKSEEAAGVAMKLLFADDEPGAQVYGCAADRDQASIIYEVASKMVAHHPKLRSLAKPIPSVKRIVLHRDGSYYRALSSEVAGKHGFKPHGVIFDEIHAQESMDLWSVMTFGVGAMRAQPLIYGITTAGVVGESPVAEMLHEQADQILRGIVPCPDHFYPVMYGAEPEDDWSNEEVWYEANPLLKAGVMRIETVREEFADAKGRPKQENDFRRFRLNQWVSQNSRWIQMDAWDKCRGPVELDKLRDVPCYIGVDLSTKMDLTAVVACWRTSDNTLHYHPLFWVPQDTIKNRPNIEASKYEDWIKHRHVTAVPGSSISFEAVRERIKLLGKQYKIKRIACDPRFAGQLMEQLTADGFDVVEFMQNSRRQTEPANEFEAAILDGRVRHGGNPVLRWMADCVEAKQKANGEIILDKPDRKKSSKRIDGIVAAVMATACALLDVPRKSIFDYDTEMVL
jgi:phage terminase large subunit-like protein